MGDISSPTDTAFQVMSIKSLSNGTTKPNIDTLGDWVAHPAVLASVGNQVDLQSLNNVVNRCKPVDPITLKKKKTFIHGW